MTFQGQQAKLRRLFAESAVLRLLRSDNAPHVLAFMQLLFAQESEVPYSRARTLLRAELERAAELGTWQTETGAATYLNQWIKQGWLREMDDHLTKTDASDTALRFIRSLDDRPAGTTASHLRIVQEAVRDLSMSLSADVGDRVAVLQQRQAELQHQIDDLNAGLVPELTELQQRERIREIYQLASVLTGDFRMVEDEIRQMDKELRVKMIDNDTTRGSVLTKAMAQEDFLAKTEAGGAFESFFQLLCDDSRTTELREQLRALMSQPIAAQLNHHQRQYLSHLMRELNRESERVFKVRRRTEEGLRSYIESGAAAENQAVDHLISQLEQVALSFLEHGINLQQKTALSLDHGVVQVQSPESIRLKNPDDKLDTSAVQVQQNTREPSATMLDALASVQVRELARVIRLTLQHTGPLTLGALAAQIPITAGLEELVGFIRVAKAIQATLLEGEETVRFTDVDGRAFKASVPKYVLSFDLFPVNVEDLVL